MNGKTGKNGRPVDLWVGTRRRPRMQWGPADVVAAVAVGGALGALARYAIGTAWPHDAGTFPWSTFAINVTGCLTIGVLLVTLTEVAGRPHRLARPFLGTGILGGFTTFSTYAVDAELLIAGGHAPLALAYLFGTLAAALLAAQTGVWATRTLATRHLGKDQDL